MNGTNICHTTCNWCGRPTHPVWVHGHAQCEHCRINIEPCCQGDAADNIPAADIGAIAQAK